MQFILLLFNAHFIHLKSFCFFSMASSFVHLMVIASQWIIYVAAVPGGLGMNFSSTSHQRSAPVWHHDRLPYPFVFWYHHKAWLSFPIRQPTPNPLLNPQLSANMAWALTTPRHNDGDTQHKTSPFKSRAIDVASNPILFEGKMAEVHTPAWL